MPALFTATTRGGIVKILQPFRIVTITRMEWIREARAGFRVESVRVRVRWKPIQEVNTLIRFRDLRGLMFDCLSFQHLRPDQAAADSHGGRAGRTGLRRGVVACLGLAAICLSLAGCRSLSTPVAWQPLAGVGTTSVVPPSLIARAAAAEAEARRLERRDDPACVDQYYAAAALTALALEQSSCTSLTCPMDARNPYFCVNERLRLCLLAARRHGRFNLSQGLSVVTPAGLTQVPVVRSGFVWQPIAAERLVDAKCSPRNQNQHRDHLRCGLGVPQVVVRPNPNCTPADRFFPRDATYNATAVLRPDPAVWCNGVTPSGRGDVLELHDPWRVRTVRTGAGEVTLAADWDAANAEAAGIAAERGPFNLSAFVTPGRYLDRTDLRLLEPYQPGKIPVILIHGLITDSFIFSDMISELQLMPGFKERYQLWVFRYPTGANFLRTASTLRTQLREAVETFDPLGQDHALRESVLVGYSMGGLLAELQTCSSGDALWNLASCKPLDAIVTPESSRSLLRQVFYFEPNPYVRRVIYVATPHGGSGVAYRPLGWLANSLVERPEDARRIIEQIERDNPDAVRPFFARQPNSIELLGTRDPVLDVLKQLPRDPRITQHSIVGTGLIDPMSPFARGDLVVPLESSSIPGVVSELRVQALHTNIYYQPETIAEVKRILIEHALTSSVSAQRLILQDHPREDTQTVAERGNSARAQRAPAG
jgi:pimeloyl-ACP methyl ester carboxylesterase